MVDKNFPTDVAFATFTGRAGILVFGDDAVAADGGKLAVGAIRSLIAASVNTSQTLAVSDLGKTISVDATSGIITLVLPSQAASPNDLAVGDAIRIVKSAGTNKVIVQFSSTDLIWLSSVNDASWFRWDGSTWIAFDWSLAPLVNDFAASGTWTKAPKASLVVVEECGGGGGAGAGRRGAAASVRCGGGAGGHASFMREVFQASLLGATETVTIGAAGTGGAAVTADNTNGNNGTAGATTSFGTWVVARGGGLGSGGTATTGSQGQSYGGSLNGSITNPAGASTTGGSPAAGSTNYATGNAASGGGISSGDVSAAGGTAIRMANDLIGTAPTAGSSSGGNGGDGATDTSRSWWQQGQPGSGGGGSITGAAGRGGDASGYGLGGGGGGASLNGNNSGRGGNGSPGFCRVITLF